MWGRTLHVQVHQFKGSSASFGARQIAALCVHLREACQAQDRARCQQLLVQVKQQFQVRDGGFACLTNSRRWVKHPHLQDPMLRWTGSVIGCIVTLLLCSISKCTISMVAAMQVLHSRLNQLMQLESQLKAARGVPPR